MANGRPECSWCGKPAVHGVCPGDGAVHRHGGIHRPPGYGGDGFGYVCADRLCNERAAAEWSDAREMNAAARAVAR